MGYTLNKEGKLLLTNSIKANTKMDLNDKGLFEWAYAEYKTVARMDRHLVTAEIKKHIEAKVESVNIQNALLRVIRVAYKYLDMQVIANFDKLEYANIKSLVNLFSYIDKNFSNESNTVRDTIKSLHQSDMSPHRYNNIVVDNIKTLRGKYKVVETVEGEVVTRSYRSIVSDVLSLSDEDKAKIIALLTEETEEVA